MHVWADIWWQLSIYLDMLDNLGFNVTSLAKLSLKKVLNVSATKNG